MSTCVFKIPFTFADAQKHWDNKRYRQYANIGKRISKYVYLTYEESNNWFVLNSVTPSYKNGRRVTDRNAWDCVPFAILTPSYIQILHARNASSKLLKSLFGISYCRPLSNKIAGFQIVGHNQSLIGDFPILLDTATHNITLQKPLRRRKHDIERRKALDALIKRVAFEIGVREKMGVFPSFRVLYEYARSHELINTRAYIACQGRNLISLLEKTDIEKLESYYSLAYVALYRVNGPTFASYSIHSSFLSLTKKLERESLLIASGAVYYE